MPPLGLTPPTLGSRESDSDADVVDTIVVLPAPPGKSELKKEDASSPESAPSQLQSSAAPPSPLVVKPSPLSATDEKGRRRSTIDFLEMMNRKRVDEPLADPDEHRRRSSIAVGELTFIRQHPHASPTPRERIGSLRRSTFRKLVPATSTEQFLAKARLASMES